MKVRVNDTELEIFNGARVKDAILKFSAAQLQEVTNGLKTVTDKYHNPVDLQGELSDAQQLFLKDAN